MIAGRTLIIGAGEIGQSLFRVLRTAYKTHLRDRDDPGFHKSFTELHLCFPYSNNFVAQARAYISQYDPSLTIIHSTVKPGTTRLLGARVAYSPVLGRHPHLEQSLQTFTKFVGAVERADAESALVYFELAGINAEIMAGGPEAAELAKVLCTTTYGMQIVIEKEIHALCDDYGVPFQEVYTRWTQNYNRGYQQLGDGQFTRPILQHMPGPTRGHCVLPNCALVDTWLTRAVLERNATYGK